MLVPSFYYGRFREVKAACSRKITQLKRGATWPELAGDDLVDTREYSCFLVIDGPNPMLGGEEHFNFFAMGQALDYGIPRRLPMSTMDTLFEPMIHTIWGFLSILCQWGQSFLRPPGHQQRYLHLAVRWWDELVAEGPRYTQGIRDGASLWSLPTNLWYCLAREGLPQELLREPVPEGGIAELVAQTRAGLPPTPDQLH